MNHSRLMTNCSRCVPLVNPKDLSMPIPRLSPAELERLRQAISTAKEINGVLQGTMGLDRQTGKVKEA
jgi:hypothetical protein